MSFDRLFELVDVFTLNRKRFRGARRRQRASSNRYFRPVLEGLEERLAPAQLVSTVLNGATPELLNLPAPFDNQHSMVRSFQLTFDTPVTLSSSAVSIQLHAGFGALPGVVSILNASGGTTLDPIWNMTFAGANTVGGSIADGEYNLIVDPMQVTDAVGQHLETAPAPLTFYRLLGDADGNSTVNNLDIVNIRKLANTTSALSGYQRLYDTDWNGTINNLDIIAFRRNANKTVAPSIVVTSPPPGFVTNQNVTVSGRVADNGSGVASVQTSLDGGAYVEVVVGSGGSFTLATSLPLDSTADGRHIQRFRATDRVGNVTVVDVVFTLDTIAPAVSIGSPAQNAVIVGNPTILGQVSDDRAGVAMLQVAVNSGNFIPLAFDTSGHFRLTTAFALDGAADGQHTLRFKATDKAGNVSETTEYSFDLQSTATPPCDFPDDLAGWTVSQQGGKAPGAGTASAQSCTVTLREGNSFDVTLEKVLQITDPARQVLVFSYQEPDFDTAANGMIRDAFEVAMVDADGYSLVPTFAPDRDAFFNLTEGQPAALGMDAALSNRTVTVDLSHVPRGTIARLIIRLVNNDSDTNTSVTLSQARLAVSTTPVSAKFFVADPGADRVFKYSSAGSAVGSLDIASTTSDVRGITINAAGSTLWTVDGSSHAITITDTNGSVSGSWMPFGVSSPEGISTDGNDIWIVDKAQRRVLRFANGASRLSGVAAATDAFALDAANTSPSDLATDGTTIWVTDDAIAAVFVYGANGVLKGRWQLDGRNGAPSGITTNHNGGNDLWVVDRQARQVFHYVNAVTRRNGSQVAVNTFTLSEDNPYPEGIADPVEVVAFDNFADLSPLKLNGSTAAINNNGPVVFGGQPVLRLTNALFQGGSAFLKTPVSLANRNSFSTSFQFQITNPTGIADEDGIGADGFVFVVQTVANNVGGGGGGIGYLGINPSLGIEFDTYNNTPAAYPSVSDPDGNHIGIDINGNIRSVATQHITTRMNNGAVWFAWVDYSGATNSLDVRLSQSAERPDSPTLSYAIDLPALLRSDQVFLGFTSGTGLASGNHDIRSWKIATDFAPFDQYVVQVRAAAPVSTLIAGSDVVISGEATSTRQGSNQTRRIVALTVNGAAVDALAADGSFFKSLTVAAGVNRYEIVATDEGGQTSSITLTLQGTPRSSGNIDFSQFSDVSTSFKPGYERTSLTNRKSILYADLTIRNLGQYSANKPLLVAVRNISNPTVRPLNFDGVTPDGLPYYDLTDLINGAALLPGQKTGVGNLAFFNPERAAFRYDLVVLAVLNRAPSFTSIPSVNAIAGRPYGYVATATDPDGDSLAYSLVTGPTGMTIDSASGALTWVPSNSDIGTSDVLVRVDDGRGGRAEQQFVLTVASAPPNRPPLILSKPATEAEVGQPFRYDVIAVDIDGDALSYAISSGSLPGMSIDSATGVLRWTPSVAQIGIKSLTITVNDGNGGTAAQAFSVCVTNDADHAPAIISQPVTTVGVSSLQLPVYASEILDYFDSGVGPIPGPYGIANQRGATPVSVNVIIGPPPPPPIVSQNPAVDALSLPTGSYVTVGFGSAVAVDGPGNDIFVQSLDPADSANESADVFVSSDGVNFIKLGRINEIGNVGLDLASIGFTQPVRAVRVVGLDNRGASPGFDLVAISILPGAVATPYRYAVRALDPDSKPLSYSLVQSPAGMSINPIGLITWDDPAGFLGQSVPVTVRVDDGLGGSDLQSFAIAVQQNTREIRGTFWNDSQSGFGGWTAYLDLNRNGRLDPNEPTAQTDSLGNYRFTSLPPATYAVRQVARAGWQQALPAFDPVTLGANVVDLTNQSIASDIDFRNLQISAANRDPLIVSTPLPNAVVGQLFRYDLVATDWDGDSLRFDLPEAPAGMAIDAELGTIIWHPVRDQVGVHSFVVRIQDGKGGSVLQSALVTVTPPNSAPVITSKPATGPFAVGAPIAYRVVAQDAEQSVLLYSLQNPLPGMTINSAGLFTWTPTTAQVGNQSVTVLVSDGTLTTQQLLTFAIAASASDDAPQIVSSPRTTAWLGTTYINQIQAVDPNGDPLTYQFTAAPTGMQIDGTGLITWSPTATQFGVNPVSVSVSDGRGISATQSFAINVGVQPSNQSPIIVSTPPNSATVGSLLSYDPVAFDADGDPLTWSLSNGPDGMSINPQTGTLCWLPAADQEGPQTITITSRDVYQAEATQTFVLDVSCVTLPPIIKSAPVTTAAVATNYFYPVQAFDPDGGSLTYSVLAGPAALTIDSLTGLVRWTPTVAQVGTQQVTLKVSDNQGNATTQQYAIVVSATPANRPPVITSTPSTVASVNRAYTYSVTAADPDGGLPTLALETRPDGMTMTTAGVITWTPTSGQLGAQTVVLTATDAAGAKATQSFTVRVKSNQAPSISSAPVATVTAGAIYRYDVGAIDPDLDPLTYTLTDGPTGMTIDAVGRVSWPTSPADVSAIPVPVTITVADNQGATATKTFAITMTADSQPPMVKLAVALNPIDLHGLATLRVTASDNIAVTQLSVTVGGAPVALDRNGFASVRMDSAGLFDIVASALDAAGNLGTVPAQQLRVIDPTDSRIPIVAITSPSNNASVSYLTQIRGTVDVPDGQQLDYYEVDYARADQVDINSVSAPSPYWVQLVKMVGNQPVRGGVLATFDPTMLMNDGYVIRVVAFNTNGKGFATGIQVNLEGNAKLGQVHLESVDLTVPVAGIPIEVRRVYDSRLAQEEGDFGFGWTLAAADPRIHETVALAPQEELLGALVSKPFSAGTHVFLTNPEGKRVGFTFDPTPEANIFLGLVWHPRFRPDPGVVDRLEVDDVALGRRSDGTFVFKLFGINYNPQDYRLINKDGTVYRYNQFKGLQSITDRNGVVLTFSKDGIVSSTGESVRFARDGRGRITAITDPAGNSLQYRFDVRGDLATVTDQSGLVTSYAYRTERPHFLASVTDPQGHVNTQLAYDVAGRLKTSTDAMGHTTTANYDLQNLTETVQDPLGNITTLVFDIRGNVISTTDALGRTTSSRFDSNDNEIETTDPRGNTTKRTFDARRNITSITNALGDTSFATFDAFNHVLTATDALGRVLTNRYDAKGNLVRETDAAGGTTLHAYDAKGRETSRTDANGHTTRYVYANGSLPVQIVNPDGTSRALTYSALGQPAAITDERGKKLTLKYDPSGQLLGLTDPEGGVTQYGYQGNLLASTTDPLGFRTIYVYDDANRRISETDALGGVTLHAYDAAGREIATTNALGNTTTTVYRADGRVDHIIDAFGGITGFEYDANGNETAIIDANGNRTVSAYDAINQKISITDALGGVTQYVYNAGGKIISETDANHHTTLSAYDNLDRLVTETDALGGKTSRLYDPVGNIVAFTDANGHTTQSQFDSRDRLIQQIDPAGFTISFAYDAAGNRVSTTDQMGHTSFVSFDGFGRVLTTTDAGGGVTENKYDPAGNLRSTKDPLGRLTQYEFDALRRVIAVTDAENGVVRSEYDAVGNRTALTDQVGNRTTFEFDALGRQVREIDPLGHSIITGYDAVGNRTQVTDRNGRRRTFSFDAVNRLTDENWYAGTTIVRTIHSSYDAVGNLLAITDPDSSYAFTFDALNRQLTADNAGTPNAPRVILTRTYDAVGNRLRVQDDSGVVVSSTYDVRDLLTSRTWEGGGVAQVRLDFDVDDRGLRTSVKRYSDLTGTMLVSQTSLAYDDLRRVLNIAHTGDGVAVSSYAYSYDVASQLTQEIRNGTIINYRYDGTSQLLGATRSIGPSETYSFDNAGNRKGGDYQTSAGNRLTSDGTFTYAFDDEGNIVRKTTIATGNFTDYGYDYRNRLVSITERTAGGLILKEVRNVYDAFDRRIAVIVNGVSTFTVHDGDATWADYDASGVATARYLLGDRIDEMLARWRPGEGTAWYLTDKLGTVRELLNSTGVVLNQIDYNSFGQILSQLNPTAADRFTFTGREFDANIGLYYYRARFYDPAIGSFINQDPLRYDSGDANLYRYVGNGPLNASDPSGLLQMGEYGALVSRLTPAIFGGAIGIVAGIGTKAIDKPISSWDGSDYISIATSGVIGFFLGAAFGAAYAGAAAGGRVSSFLLGFLDGLGVGLCVTNYFEDLGRYPGDPTRLVLRLGLDIALCGGVQVLSVRAMRGLRFGESAAGPQALTGGVPKTPKGNEIHSIYPDGTPVRKTDRPPHISGPDSAAGGRPHTVLRTTPDGRIYGGKEFGDDGQPVKDFSFSQPTFPNGRPRPNHLPPPTEHPYTPNPSGGSPIRGPEQPFRMPTL